ncbi:MAG TPA: Flp pilus assembly protein CpaB [Alphaproteobacteria bacterium]|nr:Flp pilus assembly protein CpaB [Alphaproteobacteria bacterium]
MRGRAFIMFGIALVLSVIAVFVARQYLTRQAAPVATQQQPAMQLATVVVARTPLYFGTRIGREQLSVVPWPANAIPPGAFRSVDELIKPGEQRVALRTVEAGEPILQSKVSGFGGRATLSAVMTEEKRAVTIRVNDVSGVAGFLLPSDRVDILLTRDESAQRQTNVLLQNVKILGIDQIASDRQDKPVVVRAVTVEVEPLDAQKLTLAQQVGSLSLSLRSLTDNEIRQVRSVNLSDLQVAGVGVTTPVQPEPEPDVKATPKPVAEVAPPPPMAAPQPDPMARVRVIRGLNTADVQVPFDAGRVTR